MNVCHNCLGLGYLTNGIDLEDCPSCCSTGKIILDKVLDLKSDLSHDKSQPETCQL